MIWMNTFLYTALLSWGAAVFFYWRYQLKRLNLRKKLGMVQEKKENSSVAAQCSPGKFAIGKVNLDDSSQWEHGP